MKSFFQIRSAARFPTLAALLFLTVVATAPAQADHDDHGDHDEHDDEHGGPIILSAADMADFGIRVAPAAAGVIHDELRLPGEIRMNENAMAHVSPRFAGVVKRIHHRLGDEVKAGEILAEIESNETLRPFELAAPIAGTVVAVHITLGEIIDTTNYAYVIADTSTVWADLRVYQRDLPKVRRDQTVRLTAGPDYPAAEGKISYVGPVVDEVTRTGLIRTVMDNPRGLFRPGLFVIADLALEEHPLPVVVPRSAVHRLDDQDVVFVETESGEGFEASPVRVGRGDSRNIAITAGLAAGQRYVAEGGFFLKADLQKENFGDGHAH